MGLTGQIMSTTVNGYFIKKLLSYSAVNEKATNECIYK